MLGLLVAALRRRRDGGTPPFAVLCCDNLPSNGAFLRGGVTGFARETDPGLADWIAREVAFPASMVDRITPASTDATLRDAQALTGCTDAAAIETEPFVQWVIEDRFPQGRPAWEAGGAVFVADVEPYERMKLSAYGTGTFVFDPLHYLALIETKPNALDQAAPLKDWALPETFQHLRHLLEARMGNRGRRELLAWRVHRKSCGFNAVPKGCVKFGLTRDRQIRYRPYRTPDDASLV